METEVNPKTKSRIRRDVVVLLWTFIGVLYFSLASQWISTTWRDRQFAEYMDQVIRVASNEQRDIKTTRALILIKASQLSLPVQSDEVQVSGTGQEIRATVHYRADVSLPIVNQPVYRIVFDHDLKPRQ